MYCRAHKTSTLTPIQHTVSCRLDGGHEGQKKARPDPTSLATALRLRTARLAVMNLKARRRPAQLQ